jgi:hypothetical protein
LSFGRSGVSCSNAKTRMRRIVSATVIAALPLSGLLWLSGAVPIHLALGAMTLFVFAVMSAGFALLRAADAVEMPAPAAWVLGVSVAAIATHAIAAGLGLLAFAAFAVWAVFAAGAGLLFAAPAPVAKHFELKEQAGLLLCGLATVFWCRDIAEVPQFLARDGVLKTWTDQFIHGSVISQLGDPRAAGRHAIQLVDLPIPLYHYASYVLPAAFAAPLDLAGLTLATSVWVPLGFFTMCAGAYALGSTLAGWAGGVASLAALTLLPDAASYGLHNRLFGYYWYVVAVPGASYGVGICLLAIAFLQRWCRERTLPPLLAGLCLVAGSLLIRLHVFALAFPAWLLSAALLMRLLKNRRLLFLGATTGAFLLFVWTFYAVFPHSVHALEPFLDVTHNDQLPISYAGLYQILLENYGRSVALPVGVFLVLPASLGIFCILYPLSVLMVRRSRGLQAIDLVPPVFLGCYLLLIVTAPVPAYGDATELTQRPFVVVYAVVVIWTIAGLTNWLGLQGGLQARRVWLPLLLTTALSILLCLRYTVKDWRWAYAYMVMDGLPETANFVRRNSRSGDVLAAQGLKPGMATTDVAIQLVSLTGVPAYVTLPYMQASRGGEHRKAATDRYAALIELAGEESAAGAMSRLREMGIEWYVVAEIDHSGPRWDRDRRHAAFVDRMVAVYRVSPRQRMH